MKPGIYHTLEVLRKVSVGCFLGDGTDEVLLPIRYIPEDTEIGDKIEVFVYLDNENRPIATNLHPYSLINEFVFLQAVDVTSHGAFLDWGIAKDLFVPFAEQREKMEAGKDYLVYVYFDENTGRIIGSSRWQNFIKKTNIPFQKKEKVNLLVAEKTDLGYRAIINNEYEGMLYHNEIFETLMIGQKLPGFIHNVRDDQKIDLRLQLPGMEHIADTKEQILHFLKENKGTLALGDKSSPEEIYSMLNISKKAFKKTIGGLYKERLIIIADHEIKLSENNSGG